ncbi:hypothetical protein [Lentilactobacillus kefiri]|nr:hypothetical protein [Lentilactobacillus kefiri]KRL66999.1 D-alanyl-D-alanine carboxypeptidase [Lentilactobacillus parakefiri DSM 10551]MCJ2162793.1 hypothetical protein [Lentilactobacillus kefiri]MCP9370196.1 hypothetical protein [Lentilactobacillus kefiri]MDH5109525.1 hypothetical protein [Lentilactobacillus kefiri]MDM7493931.1 hypothetical protein [Lentilactobacillus kefiri]
MKKQLLKIVLSGLVFCGVLTAASTAQAKKPYSWSVMDGPLMYYTKPNVKGYIWNYSHTRKLHNVKNYRYTSWLVTNASTKRIKGKRSVYYRVYSANKKVKGLVWSGYLTKALATPLDKISSNQQYLNYINSNPSQRLTKALIKLFPNSPVDISLSRSIDNITATTPIKNQNFTDFIAISNLKDPNNPNPHQDGSIDSYLYYSYGQAITPRVKRVTEILNANGYNASKRASMTNYSLGVDVVDGALYGTTTNSPYPQHDDQTTRLIYEIYLAKNKA